MFLQVSVCSQGEGWYPSMPCRWYPSMPCSRGCAIPACIAGGIPACLATGLQGCLVWGVPGPRGACSGGPAPGGVPTPGGSAPGGLTRPPNSRRLLLRTVRILLECILVGRWHSFDQMGALTEWGHWWMGHYALRCFAPLAFSFLLFVIIDMHIIFLRLNSINFFLFISFCSDWSREKPRTNQNFLNFMRFSENCTKSYGGAGSTFRACKLFSRNSHYSMRNTVQFYCNKLYWNTQPGALTTIFKVTMGSIDWTELTAIFTARKEVGAR